ncbi:hypothetical protein MJO28_008695 [Puccinia striiformis f. sp. tritici]|uniref:Uncharacterized protein n=1 Tax=Puccinia striiformis f. sp. tritici TaxID=168172 RepID=A0ACC0EC38_9BASI|nr:hypothetical protein MJO28_008695 [Puccinia striiformis f. sp. tritici]
MVGIRGVAVPNQDKNNESAIMQNIKLVIPNRLGKCNIACEGCGALHWRVESTLKDRNLDKISFTMCCQKDKVTLPGFDISAPQYPPVLKELLIGISESTCSPVNFLMIDEEIELLGVGSGNFQGLIRMYNNSVSFTSLGAKIDLSVAGQKGINVFRINGGLTHLISSIEPINSEEAGYSHIFVVGDGGTNEVNERIGKAQGKGGTSGRGGTMREDIVKTLMNELDKHNPYAKFYRSARQVLNENSARSFKLQGVPSNYRDPKRYNQPTVEEVAVVIEGPGDIVGERQIVLNRKDDKLILISDNHSAY